MITTDAFPETRVDPGLDLDRRYTTPETMALCLKLSGVDAWDLDVAADQESHWADVWYGIEHDGLKQPWFGKVWCNPPFSRIEPWVVRAWEAMTLPAGPENHADVVAMLLPANRTEQPWWQEWVEPKRDSSNGGRWSPWRAYGNRDHRYATLRTHFLPTRLRYGHPGNPKGIRVGSPPFASVLLVWKSE